MKKKLNPCWWLKNDDDPVPPSWYQPFWGAYQFLRKICWFFRNPFHNFTFYVIGIADKPYTIRGRYTNHVYNPFGGWKWHVIEYKWLRLPFISYNGWIKFYIGWRERGNFGIKLIKG